MNFADIFTDSRLLIPSAQKNHWSCDPDDNPLHFQVSFSPRSFLSIQPQLVDVPLL
jgi:hypothetical protein